jgi:hypothetical protein
MVCSMFWRLRENGVGKDEVANGGPTQVPAPEERDDEPMGYCTAPRAGDVAW